MARGRQRCARGGGVLTSPQVSGGSQIRKVVQADDVDDGADHPRVILQGGERTAALTAGGETLGTGGARGRAFLPLLEDGCWFLWDQRNWSERIFQTTSSHLGKSVNTNRSNLTGQRFSHRQVTRTLPKTRKKARTQGFGLELEGWRRRSQKNRKKI